jgi:RND family efflux transporter MFP subunit
VIGFSALTLMLCATVGCGSKGGHQRHLAAETLPRVEVVRPSQVAAFPRRVELTVSVEPMGRVDLCARVPGVVKFLPDYVDIGRRVKEGDKLVELDVPDLIAQRAHKQANLELARHQKQQVVETRKVLVQELEESKHLLRKYEAEFNARSDEYSRTRMLVDRNAQAPEVAQEKMRLKEAAQAAWEAAQAQIDTKAVKLKASDVDELVAESKIKVVEAEIQNLEVQIGYATVTAPFAGVVTKRWVEPGATIKDSSIPLLTLMRIDQVRVLVDVPDRDAPLVNTTDQNPNPDGKGDPVTLRFPALAEQGKTSEFKVHITRKAEARDTSTRTMRAEVHIDNKAELLQPGMYGTATVLLDEHRDALTVPSSALIRRNEGYQVLYLANVSGDQPRGVVKTMPVQTGLDDGTQVEIVSDIGRDTWIITKRSSVVDIGDEVIGVVAKGK